MRLTSKDWIAVTVMMELAMRSRRQEVRLRDLSEAQHVSPSYTEQIFAALRRAGLVTGVRGPRGGYRLTRPAGEITIAEIIVSVQGQALGVGAGKDEAATDKQTDERTHDLWGQLSRKIYDFLDGMTLAQFVEQPRLQAVEGGRARESARHAVRHVDDHRPN